MDLKSFLQAVIPPDGVIITARKGTTKFQQQLHDPGDYDHVAGYFLTHKGKDDTYISLASYVPGVRTSNRKRTEGNVLSVNSVWLDIDVGPDKPYTDYNTASVALRDFLAQTNLPAPSVINNSGKGLHVYWVFSDPEPRASNRWDGLARALKNACIQRQLHADHSVTADMVRVLRPPETLNHKYGTPVPVTSVHPAEADRLVRYDITTLQAALKSYGGQVHAVSSLGTVPAALAGEVDEALVGGITQRAYNAEVVIEQCPWLSYVKETGGQDQSEPLWHRMLCIMSSCEDGEGHIHTLGDKHPGYTPESTVSKYTETSEASPRHRHVTCEDIRNNGATQCATCPHSVSSPLKLGKPPEEEFWPDGWRLGSHGLERVTADSFGAATWQVMWNQPITRMEVVRIESVDHIRIHLNRPMPSGRAYGDIPIAACSERSRYLKALLELSIPVSPTNLTPVMNATVSWYTNVVNARKYAVESEPRYGWNEDATAFVVNGQHISDAGRRAVNCAYASNSKADATKWSEAAKIITDQNWGPHLALLASAFAGPLVRFLPVPTGILSIMSAESGVGKSTTLQLAQGVWLDPRTAPMMMSDTENAINKMLSIMSTLPVYWDEALVASRRRRIADFFLRITQGREKRRLSRTANMQDAEKWSTLLVTCSNFSLVELIGDERSGTQAGALRILELDLGKPPTSINSMWPGMVNTINAHWGATGGVYAEFLVKHRAAIEKAVNDLYRHLADGSSAEHRFVHATRAALLCGAQAANAAGLTQFDMPTLRRTLDNAYTRIEQRNRAAAANDAMDLIYEYMHDTADNCLWFDKVWVTGRTTRKQMMHGPANRQTKVSYERGEEDGLIRIPHADFRRWLSAQEKSSYNIAVELNKLPYVQKAFVRIGLHAGKLRRAQREWVWDIDTQHPHYDVDDD